MTTFLVCGGRDFSDKKLLKRTLGDRMIGAVVHGNAQGADRMAGEWAKKRGIPVIAVDANWGYYGRGAGPIRNGWMLELIKIDYVLAFPGGNGTADMVAMARAAGLPVKEIS